jgi:hypothetical protein
MIKPWKILERTPVYRADPWLAVERQKVQLPDGRIVDDTTGSPFPTAPARWCRSRTGDTSPLASIDTGRDASV